MQLHQCPGCAGDQVAACIPCHMLMVWRKQNVSPSASVQIYQCHSCLLPELGCVGMVNACNKRKAAAVGRPVRLRESKPRKGADIKHMHCPFSAGLHLMNDQPPLLSRTGTGDLCNQLEVW